MSNSAPLLFDRFQYTGILKVSEKAFSLSPFGRSGLILEIYSQVKACYMLNFRKTTSFLNAYVHVFNVNSFLL